MRTFAASIVLISASASFAGPDWTEGAGLGGADARKNPPGQIVVLPLRGGPQVNSIMGGLNGIDTAGGPDVADLYQLTITMPNTKVTTGPLRSANFDTVLALFSEAGLGIVANDDVSPTDVSSQINIAVPGTYLVAVAVKGTQPTSTGGSIFNFMGPGAQFAQVPANGPGAAQPLVDWNGSPVNPEPRNYVLDFAPSSVPTVSEMGLIVLGGAFMVGAVLVMRRGAFVG